MNDLVLLATICCIAMVSPGPDFILVTRNSLLYPRSQALATALGIVSGCLVHATYCILGLALIITKSVILFSLIKYAGACYLVYLGLKGLFSKSQSPETRTTNEAKKLSIREAFVQGFLCNLLNPKLAVFLLSIFTQFISVDANILQKSAVAGIFVLEAAIYWPLLVLLLQWKVISKTFSRVQLYLDRVCGAVLIGLGVRVAVARD